MTGDRCRCRIDGSFNCPEHGACVPGVFYNPPPETAALPTPDAATAKPLDTLPDLDLPDLP